MTVITLPVCETVVKFPAAIVTAPLTGEPPEPDCNVVIVLLSTTVPAMTNA